MLTEEELANIEPQPVNESQPGADEDGFGGDAPEPADASEPADTSSSTEGDKPVEDRGFQYPTKLDEMRNLPGGVYLDDVQREKAEIIRAKHEDREPDLENPPAMQSTPLVESNVLARLDPRAKGRDADVTLPVGITPDSAKDDENNVVRDESASV